MTDDFNLEIRQRDGTYLIVARSYGVAVRQENLRAGVEEALTRIDAVAETFRQAGLPMMPSPEAWPRHAQASRLADYLPPAIISGVVLAGFVLLASMPLFNAVASLNRIVDQVSAVTNGAKIENVGHNVARILVHTGNVVDKISPERKEELREAVRKIMVGLAPIIEEVGDSLNRNPSPTPPATR